MLKYKIMFGSICCLLAGALVGQTLCQTQGSYQRGSRPDSREWQQAFEEQRKKEFEKRVAENKERQDRWMAERQKEFKDRANGKDQRRNELIRQTLRLTDEQWKVIEPKINRVYFLKDQSGINIGIGGGGAGYGGTGPSSPGTSSADSTVPSTGNRSSTWKTQSSSGGRGAGGSAGGGSAQSWSGPLWRLADRELTEGEKACEELLALLEDKNSRQEDVEPKAEALRRAKQNAARELAKARQELREVLTFRQQARLVLAGLLD